MSQPLPEKQNMTIDRFDKEFVRFREVALNRFINRLCEHPILSHEKCLHSFLTMEQAVSFMAYVADLILLYPNHNHRKLLQFGKKYIVGLAS